MSFWTKWAKQVLNARFGRLSTKSKEFEDVVHAICSLEWKEVC